MLQMQFSEIVNHGGQNEYLQQIVANQSIPHAMLFWGHEGTGKLATAIAFTQFLFCQDRQNTGSCGKCAGCVKSEKIIHPDVHFVYPTVGKSLSSDYFVEWRETLLDNPYLNVNEWLMQINDKEGRGNIRSAEIEEIFKKLSLRSYEGNFKVMIIWMAEYLGKEGNKLLKLIEEPPADTVIILITEDRNAILPTIISRCQQVHFKPLKADKVAELLQRKLNVEPGRADSIASNSHGNWNLAQKLLLKTDFFPIDWLKGWLQAIWSKEYGDLRAWVDTIVKHSRDEQRHYLTYALDVMQKLFWIKWGVEFHTDETEMEILKWLNKKIELNELDQLVKLCESSIAAIDRNANHKIVWMDASIQMRTALTQKHGQVRA